ncbi:hypothetical protein TB1_003731 [Malus domestica]
MEQSRLHPLPHPPLSDPRNASGFPVMPYYLMTVGPAALPAPIENHTENLALLQGNHENSALAKLIHPKPPANPTELVHPELLILPNNPSSWVQLLLMLLSSD